MTVIEPWMISVDATIHHASILDSSLPPPLKETTVLPQQFSRLQRSFIFSFFFFSFPSKSINHTPASSSRVHLPNFHTLDPLVNTRGKNPKAIIKLVMERDNNSKEGNKERIKEWLFSLFVTKSAKGERNESPEKFKFPLNLYILRFTVERAPSPPRMKRSEKRLVKRRLSRKKLGE